MVIKKLSITDFKFEEFIEKYKKEVGSEDHMRNWLNDKKLSRIDQAACLFHGESIVGISCEKIYDNKYLRIGSPHYVLKEYRVIYPHSLFCDGGFFSKHLKTAEEKNLEVFFSIHVYNKRMKLHAENFYKRRITFSKNLQYIDDTQFLGVHKFHNVNQHIFSYNITDTQDLLDTINHTNRIRS